MRCPPIRVRRPGSGSPAVRCPVTWGRRPVNPALGRLLSTRPASSRLASAPSRPDASVSSHAQAVALGPGRGAGATVTTGTGGGPRVAAGPSTARSTVAEAGTRAMLPTSRWSVGGRWRTRTAGVGGGRGGRACPLSDQAGQADARSAPRGRLRGGRGAGCSARWPHAAWLASSGWGRDHGGWSSSSLTAGWADLEGPLEVPAGMGVRPSAAPAGSERSQLGAGSALTCDDGWWACQDLNLGPHPET